MFARYGSAKAIAGAPVREIEKLIKAAGFFRVKAKRIKEISKAIVEKYKGRVPASRAELMGGCLGLAQRPLPALWFMVLANRQYVLMCMCIG